MAKSLETIGIRTAVVFVHDSPCEVLAKVDTGADSSSVWASEIEEHDGQLSFVLFAKGSRYYTGRRHTLSSYSTTRIKNSFGDTEDRYKVPLSVRIGAKRIKAEFNLSDRSRNRYPVLIGKKTLAGKFLVDPSHAPSRTTGKRAQRVLVLNSLESKSVRSFVSKVNTTVPDVDCDFKTYNELMIHLSSTKASVLQVTDGTELVDYDLVYFKTHIHKQEFAAVLGAWLDSRAVQYIDEEIRHHCFNTKVTQYMRLWLEGLPIPGTVILNRSVLAGQYDRLVRLLGTPFILKDPEADKGLRNYLVHTQEEFENIDNETPAEQYYYVAQEYIPNDGDLRLIVLNKKVEMIISRRAAKDSDSHLNNTSTGGEASLLVPGDTDAQVRNIAIRSAIALRRQVAGVDLMRHAETGEWYVLEVNNSPQLASGAFPDEKVNTFGNFLRQMAKK